MGERDCLRLSVARDLRLARQAAGISQREFALALGVQQSRISKLERGVSAMTVETLEIAALHLGMRVKITLEPDS